MDIGGRSMARAQRAYDNQTPWDNEPTEPDEDEVDEWVKNGNGREWAEESWEDDTGLGRGMDFDSWVTANWGRVVEMYIDEYEEPEPPEYERGIDD